MMSIKHFGNLVLENFTNTTPSYIHNCNYGDAIGNCDTIGWNIIFFRKDDKVCAVSIEDVLQNEKLLGIANNILSEIFKSIYIGIEYSKINKIFGQPINKDNLFTKITRYYFLVDEYLIVFGITSKIGLVSAEIITDNKIIKDRMSIL